jgi:hypothetical protein
MLREGVVAVLLLASGVAQAQDWESPIDRSRDMEDKLEPQATLRQPYALSQQPLTLPGRTLELDGAFGLLRLPVPAMGTFLPGFETDWTLAFGAGFGITDNLTVRALIVPLTFTSNGTDFGNPTVSLLYRLSQASFAELGAEVDVLFPVASGSKLTFDLGLPLLLRAAWLRVDTGLFVALGNDPNDNFRSALTIPLLVSLDVTEQGYIGVDSGPAIPLSGSGATVLPLGFRAGFRAKGKLGPIVDVGPVFEFPFFFEPNPIGGGQNVTTSIWVLSFSAKVYLYL